MRLLSLRRAYNAKMPKFLVIDGTPPPDTPQQRVRNRIKAGPKPAAMLSCYRCGGREVLQLKTGVLMQNGKPTRGTKAIVCAHCFMKGERVVLA